MNKYYLTFGENHKDYKKQSLKNCYTIIYAYNMEKARSKAFKLFFQNWSGIYSSADTAGIIKYNVSYVPLSLLIS